MKSSSAPLLVGALAVAALVGCSSGSGVDAAQTGTPDGGKPYTGPVVTYYKDIQPLVATNCQGCHTAGGIGPFDLSSYEALKSHGAVAAATVAARVMPPWMPSDEGRPLRDVRRLTDEQIQLMKDWVAQGMPAGDPADAQQVDPPVSTFRADGSFPMATPYTPNTSLGTDDYHCFVIDPQLSQDKAVTAFNFIPGDPRVVHHVILFGVEKADQTRLAQLQSRGDGHGGYTCFGSSGIDSAVLIGGWVPGTQATIFPEGTGVILKAGTKLVMQVHYNMLQVQQTTDNTEAQVQYATTQVKGAYILPILNSSFSVAPNEIKTVTADSQDVPVKVQIWGVLPHMHLHGKELSIDATYKSGATEKMIRIPRWDFHWQQLYFFQQPVDFQTGDRATLSCTFDNTAENQPVINGQQTQPKTLRWGEGTLDEMCINYVYATVK